MTPTHDQLLDPPMADDPSPARSASPVVFEVSSDAGVARFPVRGDVVRVGRAFDNDVVLDAERTVSRQHAEFVTSDGQWRVRDLGSQNGTFVNGARADDDDGTPVSPADVIGLGNVTVRLIDTGHEDSFTVVDAAAVDFHQLATALSRREREVLALVAAGHTDDQIGRELFISVKTVRSHLDRVRDKSGVRRRAELTRLAVRLGLQAPSADDR